MASLLSRITIDPQICHGKPVIRGVRYPVESMLECLAAGDSIEDLLAEFPVSNAMTSWPTSNSPRGPSRYRASTWP